MPRIIGFLTFCLVQLNAIQLTFYPSENIGEVIDTSANAVVRSIFVELVKTSSDVTVTIRAPDRPPGIPELMAQNDYADIFITKTVVTKTLQEIQKNGKIQATLEMISKPNPAINTGYQTQLQLLSVGYNTLVTAKNFFQVKSSFLQGAAPLIFLYSLLQVPGKETTRGSAKPWFILSNSVVPNPDLSGLSYISSLGIAFGKDWVSNYLVQILNTFGSRETKKVQFIFEFPYESLTQVPEGNYWLQMQGFMDPYSEEIREQQNTNLPITVIRQQQIVIFESFINLIDQYLVTNIAEPERTYLRENRTYLETLIAEVQKEL